MKKKITFISFLALLLMFISTPGEGIKTGENVGFSAKPNINLKIGIVDYFGESYVCLRTKNGTLRANTPVSIITSLEERPQQVLLATIGKKLKKSCSRTDSEMSDENPGKDHYYSLKLNKKMTDELGIIFGVAVIQPIKPIQIKKKVASTDLNNDGKLEYFRQCETMEGSYFFNLDRETAAGKKNLAQLLLRRLWYGKKLQEKRLAIKSVNIRENYE